MSLLCFNSSQNDVNCPNVYFEELYATLPRISLYVKHFKCIFFAKKKYNVYTDEYVYVQPLHANMI